MKINCLVTVPRMPYPLNSGGRIAIYDALRLLSKKYTLTLVIIDDNPENERYVPEIAHFAEKIYFFSKPRYRFVVNSIVGLVKGQPLQVGYFYFSDVQKLINTISGKFDFFFAFMIRTTQYGINLQMKKGHYAIDSMYLNYKKSQENTTSFLWKFIYGIEVPRLLKAETEQVSNFDLTTFVNRDEAEFWADFGTVATLPHGVTLDIINYDKFSSEYKDTIVFIGRMDYQPNIEAVLWFCRNVVELLPNNLKFCIIGGFATAEIIKLQADYANVELLGFVDDPYVILKSCLCTVAPMQSGGGLQTKILMAMAVESLVISSSLPINAIEGAENRVNLLVEDSPSGMINLINEILADRGKFIRVKKAAKELIIKNYSLGVIEEKLFKLVEKHLL